ncbi:bifunctional aspartate kinase/homoserine dehydrogenase I [Lysobacter pythonis]|uniref:Bifunctional aspartokinase/homoserine dehydrogenase n=1 Tax=Solilutibacter pythonis TaxID=2483112 RepID=A0A3M2HVP9_9GAMM|nr:bifunctional aspartate kinase/homoserine dehydrogenase I [Lysobacter pythonis]RMH93098.1 bifunctional aspartate kinase/homoserine dehydrogenase I [Lysobacter pythonis]
MSASLDPRPRYHAHKFGGSSLADTGRIRHVARLLKSTTGPQLAVVSAMQGVTDALTELPKLAATGGDWRPAFKALTRRHVEAASMLDPADTLGSAAWFASEFDTLRGRLEAIADTRRLTPAKADLVQGLGEVWSSRLMMLALGGAPAGWTRLDAREVLVVRQSALGAVVDWDASRANLAQWRRTHPEPHVVVTGFIARDAEGGITTLGRNGSDYSGAIFAVLFDAAELVIWTDVDGVMSADPRLVPDAVPLAAMSYAEAFELAYFGAKVLHPQTMVPAIQHALPVVIRNTLKPEAPGTRIAAAATPGDGDAPVKGLSIVKGLAVLELSGAGMIGVPGTAERLFAALHAAEVSVTMITQASSEHSIGCLIPQAQAAAAAEAVRTAFADAIRAGLIEGVKTESGIAVLAAVGDGMSGSPGIAARLTGGLAQARVNIRAIAQGASERNISVAVAEHDAERALRSVHSAFWLSPATISIGLIGPGNVGRALLAQLAAALPRFAADPRQSRRLDLRLRAIANSRAMTLAAKSLDPASAVDALAEGEPLDIERFAAHVRAAHLPHALIIDCSGSDAMAAHYPAWLQAGIHVVTPSKHAGSGELARYRAIREAERHGGQFRYEATVGAGLPVIQTLRSLLDTGDELTGFEGVLSGTLAWLFNRYDGSVPFSQLVLEAKALGYTEPDPRDDLSGTDVARKLVILAREAGADIGLDHIEVESLVPENLRNVPKDEFLARITEIDAPMQARLAAARAEGRALRYLAKLDESGRGVVGLAAPPPGHPSLHSHATDNLIQFRSRRYADNPLVVQGPGAGADVTAAGVFGDILSIARSLGALA